MENYISYTRNDNVFPGLASAPIKLSTDVELSVDYLARKFSRPERCVQDTVYEVTADAGYQHQYFLLREEMFIHTRGASHATAKKAPVDERSDIIIARSGNHCVGGCRLTFSSPKDKQALPMEEGFALAAALPELKLADETYAEASRLAVLPEFQGSVVMLELTRQLLLHSAKKGARFLFFLSPIKQTECYRKAAQLLGVEWHLRDDVAIPDREEFEGAKMVLSLIDLAAIAKKAKTKAASKASKLADA